ESGRRVGAVTKRGPRLLAQYLVGCPPRRPSGLCKGGQFGPSCAGERDSKCPCRLVQAPPRRRSLGAFSGRRHPMYSSRRSCCHFFVFWLPPRRFRVFRRHCGSAGEVVSRRKPTGSLPPCPRRHQPGAVLLAPETSRIRNEVKG